jgi:hypothetical protein
MKLSLLLVSLLFFSCQNIDRKTDFYSYSKRWDLWRVPILEPYEIVSPTEAVDVHNWHLIIKKPRIHGRDYFDQFNEYEFQLSGIDSIGVIDSILVFKSSNEYWPRLGGNYKTTFIIDAKKGEQYIFSDEHHQKELRNMLHRLGADRVKLYYAQEVKDNFRAHLKLPEGWH